MPKPIAQSSARPGLVLRESCGLAHEPQVIEIAVPPDAPSHFVFEDARTGARWPGQRAERKDERGYLFVELPAGATLDLRLAEAGDADAVGDLRAALDTVGRTVELANGRLALRCFLGEEVHPDDGAACVPGPVLAVRTGAGAWRGSSFFDCRAAVVRRSGRLVEEGPVRIGYHFRAELRDGGWYEAAITLDREACFARVRETFSTAEGDQLVWDFSGAGLPSTLHVLDSGAGMASRPLDYCIDRRQARLWCWTQQSQLFDLVDGLAVGFAEGGDTLGMVTMAGGSWRGNRLNHIEAWARRWADGDPWSRRRTPAETRADAMPGPDRIPARGSSSCRPHFTLEAWLGQGSRDFALVLTSQESLWPEGRPAKASLAHFEMEPAPERYRAEQGLLRRLHVQRGLFSLEDQLAATFAWGEEPVRRAPFDESLRHHIRFVDTDPRAAANRRQAAAYLEARVRGFWEGSGLAYTNPVVSRWIAPCMAYFEWLRGEGLLEDAERARWRAWFAFLAALFATDHCYPGRSTMRPLGDPDGVEPTLQGMANQNFYTDVFNVHGVAAQVFHRHPAAQAWRERAVAAWDRQLDYHVYPASGVWEESHTYYLHVLHTMLALLLRWRDDGVVDFFADARMQRLVGVMRSYVTPRDALYGGRRHLLAWGDHDATPHPGYVGDMSAYATAFAAHVPALAGNLAWLSLEMGGTPGGLSPQPLAPVSEDVRGIGFVFRGPAAGAGEVLLALRAGAAWGHHHNDDGSLQMFAFGRALIVDACHGHPPKEGRLKFAAHGHSRPVPAGVDPANWLYRFSRGWIAASSVGEPFACAVAWLPTQMHMAQGIPLPLERPLLASRTVVRLAPALFAVIDETDAQRDYEICFHLGMSEVVADGRRLRGVVSGGCVELIAAADGGEWSVGPLTEPADGEPGRVTRPCKWSPGRARPHITVLALLVDPVASPKVTVTAAGAAIEHEGRSYSLSRTANGWEVCSGDRADASALSVRIPLAFTGG